MSSRPPASRIESDTRALWERATEMDRERTSPLEAEAVLPAEAPAPSVPELLEVAREVGISADSVLLSVAEGRLPDAGELRPRRNSPLWHRLLIEIRDALEISLHLPLPPSAALGVVDAVMTRPDYRMVLEDRVGGEGEDPWASVFRALGGSDFSDQSSFQDALHLCDGRVVVMPVVPDPEGGSRPRIRMPLYERGLNLTLSGGAGVLGGAGGASLGAAAGEAVVAALLAGASGRFEGAVTPISGDLVMNRLGCTGSFEGQATLGGLGTPHLPTPRSPRPGSRVWPLRPGQWPE